MRWGHPDLWWLLAIPVVVIALLVYGHVVRRHLLDKAGHLPLVQKLIATFSLERRLFKQLLLVLAVVLVTLAAIRPQYGRRPQPLKRTGIDLVVAFDISKSMLARDVQPSRIQAARQQLEILLRQLQGHRMALVPFAGVAFVQTPLTHDRSAIRLYLDSLDPMAMPVGGTNLAMALQKSLQLLSSTGDRGDKSGRSRVVLLITDGEDAARDQGEAAREQARKADEAGVKVFAVAVGTRLGEPIPVLDEEGNHAGYQKDSQGKPIYSKLNMELLEELSRLADPEAPEAKRVFNYDGADAVADALADELDALQKADLASNIRHRHGEKFQFVLVPALVLLLLELLLAERRRRREEV